MAAERKNPQAQHGDRRVEKAREEYGELADLTVGELQERARRQGVASPSKFSKEELLKKLSGGGQKE